MSCVHVWLSKSPHPRESEDEGGSDLILGLLGFFDSSPENPLLVPFGDGSAPMQPRSFVILSTQKILRQG